MAKTYRGKSLRPGGGGRSAKMKAKGVPGGVIGIQGRKKYGKKKMAKWAAAGRKRKKKRAKKR